MASDYLRELLFEPTVQEPDDGEVRGELIAKLAELEKMDDVDFDKSVPDFLKGCVTRQQEIETTKSLLLYKERYGKITS